MQAISFYLFFPLIWVFSRLPLSVLYFVSDYIVYPILYKMIGYRKKVVRDNIFSVYPEKSEKERLEIESKFYHFLSDMFLETVKSFSISQKELERRLIIENEDAIKEAFAKTNGVILTVGHVGNYEWIALRFPFFFKMITGVPYRQLTNPYFDKFFKKSRERGGADLFHTHKTQGFIKEQKGKYVLALANDQSAPPDKSYWTKFLNRDTSFFVGTEKLAKQLNFGVVFGEITVRERGVYVLKFDLITDKPTEEPAGFIMEQHAKRLEKNIHDAPQYWLWSHKRWKHKKPAGFEYGFVPRGRARKEV
jgi:KDO2-lipid IV(A) lauroyltransferase